MLAVEKRSEVDVVAVSVPCAEENAIEMAAFVVVLSAQPDATAAAKVKAALNAISDELPGLQDGPQGIFFSIGPAGPAPTPPLDFARFFAAPDGKHQWRAQLVGNVVQVSCFKYTRFDEVWGRAQKYLHRMLGALDRDTVVKEVGHQVVDKFLYAEDMADSDYQVDELFRRDSLLLTGQTWNSGTLWHVFQGWFEQAGPDVRVLNQLNVSNTELAPKRRFAAVIEHRCTAQLQNPELAVLGKMEGDDGAWPALDEITRRLHARNKQLIQGLLTEPPRFSRRPVGLSQAGLTCCSRLR